MQEPFLKEIKFSVVIATKNRAGSLLKAINHILHDDYPYKEIIVIDGASNDNTVDILKSFGERIKWISECDNGEFEAYNKGIEIANGDIIKWTTDDDLIKPGIFKVVADYFAKNPDTDILFGRTNMYDIRGKKEKNLGEYNISTSRLGLKYWIRNKQGVTSVSSFIRKDVFNEIGYLKDYVCLDKEYFCRAATVGLKMDIIPIVVCEYFITGMNTGNRRYWKIKFDNLKIAWIYGNLIDVCYVFYRHCIRPFTSQYLIDLIKYFRALI